MTENKWALVTGASRGIGREIALFLAKNQINVVVHSRSLKHTESLICELKNLGIKTFAVGAELSDEMQVRKMADEIDKRVALDYLFNNAGIQPKAQTPFSLMNVVEYIQTYKVNLVTPMILIEKFLPKMIEQGFGRICNTTSGIIYKPEQSAYAASKGALDKISKDFSKKIEGTGVTINVADPGWIQTDLGGKNAPNLVDTVVPGMALAAFTSNDINGKWILAQAYKGLGLEKALEKLEQNLKEITW